MLFARVCRIGICLMLGIVGPSALAQTNPPKPLKDKPARGVKSAPSNPCSQFGAGFIRVEGSDTCVRVGGGISAGIAGSR